MDKDHVEVFEYVPPKLEIFEMSELMERLGPAVSCSGYNNGAVGGC